MQNTKPILLVDDDDINVMIVRRALKTLNVANELVRAANGEDALEYLKNNDNQKPCLIFLDLNMPRMNGWEFLDILKTEPSLQNIPVAILTTSNSDWNLVEKYKPMVVGYTSIPAGFSAFIEAIKEQLEKLPDIGIVWLTQKTTDN